MWIFKVFARSPTPANSKKNYYFKAILFIPAQLKKPFMEDGGLDVPGRGG
jgi:hypothetical protein